MTITFSMFYNCACSIRGGAIYFDSSNSKFRMICAHKCSCGANYYGQFAYLRVSQVNIIEYLSVSHCSHSTTGYYPIYLQIGNQRVDNLNSSMNYAYYCSGICIHNPSAFTCSYSTFSNNKASDRICLWFIHNSGTMSFINIVYNNSPSGDGVLCITGGASYQMQYCTFDMNQDTLFCLDSGALNISNSFIEHSATFSTLTSVITLKNNSLTKGITHQIQFFNSYYCNTDIQFQITNEISQMESNEGTLELTNNNHNDDTFKSNPFLYSTVFLTLIIIVLIAYILGSKKNSYSNNEISSSSTCSSKIEKLENFPNNNNKYIF